MRRMLKDERGVTAIEYTFILALVVLAVLVGVIHLGGGTTTSYNDTATKVGNAIK